MNYSLRRVIYQQDNVDDLNPNNMTGEGNTKKGFFKKAASNASKAAGGAINNAKNQAKTKATEFVVKQAKKNAETQMEDVKNKLFGKKQK